MSFISIQDNFLSCVSVIPNEFVETYMPQANGEFVKIYLYLLMMTYKPNVHLTLSSLADIFSCTEKDILRALLYWEKAGLLALSFDGMNLNGIRFLSVSSAKASKFTDNAATGTTPSSSGSLVPFETHSTEMSDIPTKTEDALSHEEAMPTEKFSQSLQTARLSNRRVRKLQKENDEIRQLLFLAEQYMGRTLNSTDISRILYFYDVLHFPMDLLEYLIEYCVSKGSTSLHYIEKVGLEWHQNGIQTVKMAKSHTNTWNKHYYAILKAFGIRNRNPVPAETECMERWLKEYGFSMNIINEACSRTVTQTGHPSFQYAEGILSSWKKQGVQILEDIQSLDNKHKANQHQKTSTTSSTANPVASNRFNNFHQRDYDYKQLEKELHKKQLMD
ncbi:MAG: DnaD domain protein [Lachnospiraceae bacterium]|nr:DnaD domain protein [Lachnospiraceae bacterium]